MLRTRPAAVSRLAARKAPEPRVVAVTARETDVDDATLLAGAAAGRRSSVEALYHRYRDGAMAVAHSVLGDSMEAEDVVQEVFVALPRMARSFNSRRGAAPSWLFRGVRNRAIDHARRRARETARVIVDPDDRLLVLAASDWRPGPAEQAEADEMLDVVERLDPRHAHLVRLAFVDGWSHSAIAGMTGLPLGTVKTRIRLSLRLIRAFMAEADVTADSSPLAALVDAPSEPILVEAGNAALRAGVARYASGLCPVVHVSVLDGPELDTRALDGASVVVVGSESGGKSRRAVERVDALGWEHVPMLVHGAPVDGQAVQNRPAPVIVAGDGEAAALPLAAALTAAVAAGAGPVARDAAVHRLMHADDVPVIRSDRLGRITGVSSAMARLLARTPRELTGIYVAELSAMPRSWSEGQWHDLVNRGWWAGEARLRARTWEPVVHGVAWMTATGAIGVLTPAA